MIYALTVAAMAPSEASLDQSSRTTTSAADQHVDASAKRPVKASAVVGELRAATTPRTSAATSQTLPPMPQRPRPRPTLPSKFSAASAPPSTTATTRATSQLPNFIDHHCNVVDDDGNQNSHQNSQNSNNSSNQCLIFDGGSVEAICDLRHDPRLQRKRIELYHLKHCHRPLSDVLSGSAWTQVRTFDCSRLLDDLVTLEKIVYQLMCDYESLLARYNCDVGFSVNWSCQDCRVSVVHRHPHHHHSPSVFSVLIRPLSSTTSRVSSRCYIPLASPRCAFSDFLCHCCSNWCHSGIGVPFCFAPSSIMRI